MYTRMNPGDEHGTPAALSNMEKGDLGTARQRDREGSESPRGPGKNHTLRTHPTDRRKSRKDLTMACKVRVNRHGRLLYRIHWSGFIPVTGKEETREGSTFKDTPANRKIMEAQATLIDRDIKAGTFDYLKWFPNGNVAKYFREEKSRG